MKKYYGYIMFAVLMLSVGIIGGCTDSDLSSFESLGHTAQVTCYSGGKVFYNGHSTGKVQTTAQSDGWEFREAGTNQFIRVSGECVVRQSD